MFRIIFLVLVAMLAGCASRAPQMASYDYEPQEIVAMEADSASLFRSAKQTDMSARNIQNIAGVSVSDGDSPPVPTADAPAQAATSDRMVYYSGYLHLRVVRQEEATQAIADMTRELGGFVESMSSDLVVVRVPVDTFEDAFQKATALGDVLDRSISAQDVTDAFTDVSLRQKTLNTTHDRLVELLAKARTEEDKLTLLRQIQRVREELDVTEQQMRTLSDLASFSRLTVQVSPRGDFRDQSARIETDGMGWIQRLSPFSRGVGANSKRVALTPPEGMVQLNPRGRFIAESADGAMIWTSRLENAPRGDAAFWIEAIQERMTDEFDTIEPSSVGGFVLLHMTEQGEPEGYRYLVGIRDTGKWLEVVQVYYPSKEHEDRYGEDVMAAIRGGQS